MRSLDKLLEVKHVWIEESDRWILIKHYESGYLGLNFMQGNEYLLFSKEYAEMDRGLSEFYNVMYDSLKVLRQSLSPLEFIDKVMWIYFEAKARYEEFG